MYVGLFSRHAEEIVNFLLHVYLPAPLPADNPCIIYGLNCSSDVFLKCGALMAFAKGCVSKGHSGVHKRTQAAATTFFEFIQEQRYVKHNALVLYIDLQEPNTVPGALHIIMK